MKTVINRADIVSSDFRTVIIEKLIYNFFPVNPFADGSFALAAKTGLA